MDPCRPLDPFACEKQIRGDQEQSLGLALDPLQVERPARNLFFHVSQGTQICLGWCIGKLTTH